MRNFATLMIGTLILVHRSLAADPVEFNRDVRPILSDNCFYCHGPDNHKREADLRLDKAESLFGDRNIVVPKQPAVSRLLMRILSEDPEEKMPPPRTHKSLTPDQMMTLRKWIEQGAPYEAHWSYMPLRDVSTIPGAASLPSTAAAIDFWVDRELTKRDLPKAPAADPITLLRRVYFDVIGLPPSPQQVDQFLQDTSSNRWARLVDQLLESPHFGERMAIWWLDLVRYADSVGYHGDQAVSVWPFRDYVISAFNQNLPFDVFTIEQLAGDLLPEPTRSQTIASGYNRLGMMSAEGGVQDKEYLAKYIAERVRNVSGTWMGVTMGCCECHDHKFDPFSTREFYQMEAFFADIKERGLYEGANQDGNWGPSIKVPNDDQQRQLAELNAAIRKVEEKLAASSPELEQEQRAWETTRPKWINLRPLSATSAKGTTLTVGEEATVLASGDSPATDIYTITIADLPAGTNALRLEVLPDERFPNNGPGRSSNGNFVLTELVARQVSATQGDSSSKPLRFSTASASYEQVGGAKGNPYGKWSVLAAIDQDVKGTKWGWAIMEQVGQSQQAVFHLAEALSLRDNENLVIELRQEHDHAGHTIGRFQLAATSDPPPVGGYTLNHEINSILAIGEASRNQAQREKLSSFFRTIALSLQTVREELAQLNKKREDLESTIPTTLVTVAVEPRSIRVLPRGNWMDDSGEIVEPDFPSAIVSRSFTPQKDRRLTRLDLARWLTAPDHPLTSRVLVNRLWKLYFGVGLSPSLDDLGAQGEPPTHPELLDDLARRLVESGWNLKELIRGILNSETYQRSSLVSAEGLEKDGDNRWLGRQRRFRLDAELIRDNALAISGLLVRDIGGASVKPYQPPGYWAYLNFPTREWINGSGKDLYRRGLYTHWQRQYLHPSLLAFDAPCREECAANRARSNTPLQSLVLLNDPTYVEAARAFAAQIMLQGGATDTDRLGYAIRQALSRAIRSEEEQILLELKDRAHKEYIAQGEQAKRLLSIGQYTVGSPIDEIEWAAWTAVARAILNLHETITRN